MIPPNNDNLNDELLVFGNGYQQVTIRIFDRWGEMIFESDDQERGWDGTFQGKELDTDVFVYYAEAQCPDGRKKFVKGNITLVK